MCCILNPYLGKCKELSSSFLPLVASAVTLEKISVFQAFYIFEHVFSSFVI